MDDVPASIVAIRYPHGRNPSEIWSSEGMTPVGALGAPPFGTHNLELLVMNSRIEDTLSAATEAFRFVQRHWPFAARTRPLTFAAIAGAGVAVGIGVGFLFAPQTGEELRSSLRDKAQAVAGSLGTRVQGLVSSLSEEAEAAPNGQASAHRNGSSPARRGSTKRAHA